MLVGALVAGRVTLGVEVSQQRADTGRRRLAQVERRRLVGGGVVHVEVVHVFFHVVDAQLRGGHQEGVQPRHGDQDDGRQRLLRHLLPLLRLRGALDGGVLRVAGRVNVDALVQLRERVGDAGGVALGQMHHHDLELGRGGDSPNRFDQFDDGRHVGRIVAGDDVQTECGQRLDGHRRTRSRQVFQPGRSPGRRRPAGGSGAGCCCS